MRCSSLNRVVWLVLLGFSLFCPSGLPAQVQNKASCFVAQIGDSPYTAEMSTLNLRIEELKKRLREVTWTRLDQAEYKLKETALLDGGGGMLALSATFVSPKLQEPISKTGRSEPSDDPRYRTETALADLLKKTLFDPDLGPYGQLRVEKCTPPNPDEDDYVLTVRTPAKVKLEDGLAYELGRIKPEGGSRGLRIFFYPEDVRPTTDGTTQVLLRLLQSGKARQEDICKKTSSSSMLLLVRYSIPRSAEGASHGNFQHP